MMEMCPKPLKDPFEEAGKQADEIFGEDSEFVVDSNSCELN